MGRKETEAKPLLVAVSLFMISDLIAPLNILMLSSRITNHDFLFVYSPFVECYSNKKIHISKQIELPATIPSSSCFYHHLRPSQEGGVPGGINITGGIAHRMFYCNLGCADTCQVVVGVFWIIEGVVF
jgi:hypothetical protein